MSASRISGSSAGKRAQVDRQPVARALEPALEDRQSPPRPRDLGPLIHHVEPRHAADLLEALDDLERAGFERDDLARRLDLLPQRRLLDGGRDHVAREHEPGGLDLELLVLDRGSQGLQLPAALAEEVERVRDPHGRGVERKRKELDGDLRRVLERARADVDAVGRKSRVDLRDLRGSPAGDEILLRVGELRLHLDQARAVAEGPPHQGVERLAAEQAPPLRGNVPAFDQALRPAPRNVRGRGLGGRRRVGVPGDLGGLRRMEIGSHGAPGHRGGERAHAHRAASPAAPHASLPHALQSSVLR